MTTNDQDKDKEKALTRELLARIERADRLKQPVQLPNGLWVSPSTARALLELRRGLD